MLVTERWSAIAALRGYAPPVEEEGFLWACPSACVSARSRYRHTGCMMAEGGGPESGNAADSDSEPVAAQIPTPSTESQKQTIGSLLKTSLKKGDEW